MTENTKTVYATAIRNFDEFRTLYRMHKVWPATVDQVVYFISYCHERNYSASSVTTFLSALSWMHKIKYMQDPTVVFVVKKMMEGYRRLRQSKDIRAPITQGVLIKICQMLPNICYNEYEERLFRAAFSLAYFGLLRVGEIVTTDWKQADYALRLDDVNIAKDETSLTLRIRKSKNNHTGKPIVMRISRVANSKICPVSAVISYLKVREHVPGVFLLHANNKPVTRNQFNAVLAKVINFLQLPVSRFKSHSFRIGRATSLAMAGVPCKVIQQLGRWNSNAYTKYIRP